MAEELQGPKSLAPDLRALMMYAQKCRHQRPESLAFHCAVLQPKSKSIGQRNLTNQWRDFRPTNSASSQWRVWSCPGMSESISILTNSTSADGRFERFERFPLRFKHENKVFILWPTWLRVCRSRVRILLNMSCTTWPMTNGIASKQRLHGICIDGLSRSIPMTALVKKNIQSDKASKLITPGSHAASAHSEFHRCLHIGK